MITHSDLRIKKHNKRLKKLRMQNIQEKKRKFINIKRQKGGNFMSKINDALVSVVVELILLVPKLVKGIAKRYKLIKHKREIKSQVEQIDLENDK